MSLLDSLHLTWVEVVHLELRWKMMSREQNVDVVGIEHLRKVLVHQIDIHFRRKRQSLHEEHRVLQSVHIWGVLRLPNHFHNLLEVAGHETAVWYDFYWDGG